MLRMKSLLVVAGLCLMPFTANALTPHGDIESPDGVPDQVPNWQFFDAEVGDIHWTYAENFAQASGIAAQGATAVDVMRLIKNMPQNADARWVIDTVRSPDGTVTRYPAFMAGQRYYLPVVPDVAVQVGPVTADVQLASYEEAVAALRLEIVAEQEELAGRIAELTARVSVGEQSLEDELEAVWQEFLNLRDELPEMVDLGPIRQSISDVALTIEDIKTNTFTVEAGAELRNEVNGRLETFAASIAALNGRFAEFDARLTAEADARAAGDAALRAEFSAEIAELQAALGAFEGVDTSALEARLAEVEVEVRQLREGELSPAARTAIESVLSDVRQSMGNLDARIGALETAQTYPLRWFYAPLGLSDWYAERPGLGNFTAAGIAFIVLAMLIVALRGLFPGREGKLAKAHERLLKGDDGTSGLVEDVEQLKTKVDTVMDRVGKVEEVTDELTKLALEDLEWDDSNANLDYLQPGTENAVVWKVRKKGGAAYYEVQIGRLADTPAGQVFTDIPRVKGGMPVNTPFAISRLKLAILAAINSGRLEPVMSSHNGTASAGASTGSTPAFVN